MIRFQSIESLRGWMAWWVVVGHALHLAGFSGTSAEGGGINLLLRALTSGSTAVNVFIVISGFVICHLHFNRVEPYKLYIIRRFLRIFPIFFFCLMLAIFISPVYETVYLQDWVHGAVWRQDRLDLQETDFITHFLLHLSLLHGAIPDSLLPFSSSTFLAPAWSLSLEWQFYLVAPVLLVLLAKRFFIAACCASAMLAALLVMDTGVLGVWRYPSFLPISFQYFLLGISCRMILDAVDRPRQILLGTFILASLALSDWKVIVIWASFFAIVLMECDRLPRPQGILMRVIDLIALNPILYRIGTWSFSTYLVHIPVFSLVVGFGYWMFPEQMGRSISWGLIILAMLVTLPLSWLLYSWVERPFIRIGQRLR